MGEAVSTAADGPSSQEILETLQTLIATDALRLSERNRRFLSFVVRQTVDGHADRIKAYAIGVDVFGRDDSFDPAIDPIVRIEATRLRSALTAYYDTAGTADRIRITLPRGSYVPTFAWSSNVENTGVADPVAADMPADRAVAAVIIHDHSDRSDPETELRGEVFTDALLPLLRGAHFRTLLMPSAERRAATDAIQELFAHPGETYSLDISVRPMAEHRRYSWRFSDLRSGEVLASDSRDFVAKATPCFDQIDGFADTAVKSIASVIGTR
ncbi:hypothetical protein SAMN05428997_14021 [Bosea sp. CRIB-10]|uniref:hypothetical protein n=1 Tax=Bosea sp. CRIB-10 TaxID=378404 RepID=UPI0008EA1971|nr:hypothetical protein [Bosea sp. CRIB-10]SFD66920.1 hypothetical protein SAMN05428997_14021 [Bosea sp. CRIB-10]